MVLLSPTELETPVITRPLSGVRVLAIEQMQALPYATQLMTRLGADVVKVEHPVTGDSGRGALPFVEDVDGEKVGATYLRNALNKKSICVDLKSEQGIELIKRLVPHFDVVGENFKPGTIQRLGLGYDVLSELHPGLVYLSVSGFGNLKESPYASWPAYAIVAEAMGGFLESARREGEEPRGGAAGALGDIGSSLFAAIGTLAALRQRDQTGKGQHVDIAMFDAMVAMADVVPFFWSMGHRDKTRRASGVVSPFKAKDGYFVLQAVRDHHLAILAKAVGHPEWLEDERFATRPGWNDHLEDVVKPAIEAWAASKTKLEVCSELCGQGLAAGPCFDAEDIINDPHIQSHEMIHPIERPDSPDPLLVVGNPIKLSSTPEPVDTRWPTLGQHTREILAQDLGLSEDELQALEDAKVIRSGPTP
jgi:formyl-CoA transferase